MNNPQLDYQDRAVVMTKKAIGAELKKLTTVYDRFEEHTEAIQKNAIAAVNDARELGIHLQTLCGHEQIDFEFWNTHCKGKLPRGFKFESAKMFIAIARKLPQPAKTLTEAMQHVPNALVAAGQLELPMRVESQQRSVVSVFQKFFNVVTSVRTDFKKALREKPMEQWTPEDIATFKSETEWIAEARAQAEELLKPSIEA